MTGLRLQGVGKTYPNGVEALMPVDLTVQPGEFVVLVGPSGCGKSTLLRLVAGLETPTQGNILLDGRDITHTPPAERDIAMVFQNYALYPHMTVRDNMGFGLRMRKVPKPEREQAVREAATLLGLETLLDRRPGQLSGGQRQRVALGRAIVRQPKLFLFDEPLSNLDAALRTSTRAEIRRLHQRLGATTLYVTHDQVEAMGMADRLVVLQNGSVLQVGSPLEVYRKPINRFVASFIGSPAMNFLRAHQTGNELEITGKRLPNPHVNAQGPVLVGLRAEHLFLLEDAHRHTTLAASVLLTEELGNESLVTCVLRDGQELVVRTGTHAPLPPGHDVQLHLALEKAVFFDPDTGLTLADQQVSAPPLAPAPHSQ